MVNPNPIQEVCVKNALVNLDLIARNGGKKIESRNYFRLWNGRTVPEKDDPKSVENYTVVKVESSPMCAEFKGYAAGIPGDNFGHEAVGQVVEISQLGHVKVGDRVVVQPGFPCGICHLCLIGEYIHCETENNLKRVAGDSASTATMAQYHLEVDWLLKPIPDDMSYDHAAMACCGMGPTYGAMKALNVNAYDTIMITGLGPVGLGGVINATYLGARVIGIESEPYRAKLALELGADVVFDPEADVVFDPEEEDLFPKVLELTGGVGVDKAIDCSGSAKAHRLMIDSVKRRGRVGFIGEGGDFP